jgi:two-component system chemotaxis sensor kinase CheA
MEPPPEEEVSEGLVTMVVQFRSGLQLADLKAQLIVARLSGLGEVKSTHPDLEKLGDVEEFAGFEVRVETHHALDALRAAADVEGVESIEFAGHPAAPAMIATLEAPTEAAPAPDASTVEPPLARRDDGLAQSVAARDSSTSPIAASEPKEEHAAESQPSAPDKAATKVAETMRVDIDRLDNLMNLAGADQPGAPQGGHAKPSPRPRRQLATSDRHP